MSEWRMNPEISARYDVVVAGGGPAGFCAAVAASRAGAKTALIEREGALGGIMTLGGNADVGLFWAHGKQVIAGVGFELMERLAARGGARFPDVAHETAHSRLNVMVNPVLAANEMDRMCAEAGVTLYLGRAVCCVSLFGGTVAAAAMESRNGLEAVEAKTFIDCTGDGRLASLAGAEWELGDELQPGTYRAYIAGYDWKRVNRGEAQESYASAVEKGRLKPDDYWAENVIDYFKNQANNANHVSCTADGLTRFETEGREAAVRLANWAAQQAGGLELVSGAPHTACREWRRIKCIKRVTAADYTQGYEYSDSVCYSYYPIDLHIAAESEKNLQMEPLQPGVVPQIPFGALVVRGFTNLLVAGRCIDSDRAANSALRVKASCMAMGQAAGAAAAIAPGGDVRLTNIRELRKLLKSQGAIVPEGVSHGN